MKSKTTPRRASARERDRMRQQKLAERKSSIRYQFSSIDDAPKGVQMHRIRNGFEISLSRFIWVPAMIWLIATMGGLGLIYYSLVHGTAENTVAFQIFSFLLFSLFLYGFLRTTFRQTHFQLRDGRLSIIKGLFRIGRTESIPVGNIQRIGKRYKKLGYSKYTPVVAGMVAPEDLGQDVRVDYCELIFYGAEELSSGVINTEKQADFIQFAIKYYATNFMKKDRDF